MHAKAVRFKKARQSLCPLTEEQLLSDLEQSRAQIAAGQGLDMKNGVEETGKKFSYI